jgi:hypothetical protein
MDNEPHTPIVGSVEPGPDPDRSGVQTPDEKPDANAELRAYNKRLKAENRDFKARIMSGDLKAIGLDHEAGLGKAIAKEYDGEMTTEALAAYAKDEYGHDSAVPLQVPQEVQAGDRLDQAMQGSTPVVPTEAPIAGQAEIDKIDANDPEATRQDALKSIRAKSGQFQETFYQ